MCETMLFRSSLGTTRDSQALVNISIPKKKQLNNKGEDLRSVWGCKFGTNIADRTLNKPGSEKEPGPGQYINPLKADRGPDGEVKAVLSGQTTAPRIKMVRPTSAGNARSMAKQGSE